MPYPKIGQPLPRALDAHKRQGWILATRGHGPESERVFNVGPDDSERIWSYRGGHR